MVYLLLGGLLVLVYSGLDLVVFGVGLFFLADGGENAVGDGLGYGGEVLVEEAVVGFVVYEAGFYQYGGHFGAAQHYQAGAFVDA